MKIRRERVAYVDGRFIPGLSAISSAITNWQGEIEAAVTLFGTHRDLLQPDSSVRIALIDFAARHSIIAPAQLGHSRRVPTR
jgi:DNA-binding IclR family transcriptional regulator